MSNLANALVGLLLRMNNDNAVLTKVVPRRPSGEPIGGAVIVSKDHWPAVEMLIDEYNEKHADAFASATSDMAGNVSKFEIEERNRQEHGIGG